MLSFLKSTHILLCGGSPGADFFGTITTGDAQGDMLFVMIPALSRVVISFLTHSWCFSGRVYGLDAIGGLLPVSMSISTSSVLANVVTSFGNYAVEFVAQVVEFVLSFFTDWCVFQINFFDVVLLLLVT